jgi:crotonobetainyl-CoA:carnitine CoA-transferase CaiB-like acyl-CoA transferase
MDGVRVLDLTRVLAGPWAVQHLSDQGAEVIKVEPPEGDETRRFGPLHDGESTYFLAANRDKRSIVLDLKAAAARPVLDALLDWADVVVENFRPGVAERLGLGWERLAARWPRLVYVAIHAFGDATPGWSERPGYDLLLQHMGGITALTGWPGDPPTKSATSIADLVSGLYATQAVLLGLLHRERTGAGQKIVVNMLQAQASALVYHASRCAVTGAIDVQRGNSHAGIVPYDVYRCEDGWLVVACANDALWARLRAALDLPDDPRWRTNVARVTHRAEVDAAVQRALAGRTVADADAALAAAGVPAGPVLRPDEVLAHPAVRTAPVDHPTFGRIHLPGPVLATATTRTHHAAPPALGADTDAVLRDLGLLDRRDALAAAGAFGPISGR